MLPVSVLDLAPVPEGADVSRALANTLDLARHAERVGYARYWLAEHHAMEGIASAATAVVIGAVAGATRTIRVGAGGIMLPNHAPLMVAEAFGTLAALHGDRIDLGVGRAPGTDPATARALRRYTSRRPIASRTTSWSFSATSSQPRPGRPCARCRGRATRVPVWILGSSLFGAQLAAALGLPYAFASHFAPAALDEALAIYRETFRPSRRSPSGRGS
jgi:luciferase family oxidoreductase group 1